MQVLKDIFVNTGQIDRFYGRNVPVNLWRARNLAKGTVDLFHLVEKDQVRTGGVRPADIRIEDGWVRVKYSPRGISTFDRSNIFPRGKWEYYKIPAGTVLPAGLVVVKDNYNTRLGATHYTVAPAYDMPLSSFKFLLNKLATQLRREVA